MFHHGNLKDYLLKVLSHLLHLNSLTPVLSYYSTKTRVKFNGSCLQQPKLSYTHGTIANVYIIYELHATDSHIDDPMLKNSLFGAITLTKNADIDKYGYSGYGIGFDRKSSFTFQELMKQDT